MKIVIYRTGATGKWPAICTVEAFHSEKSTVAALAAAIHCKSSSERGDKPFACSAEKAMLGAASVRGGVQADPTAAWARAGGCLSFPHAAGWVPGPFLPASVCTGMTFSRCSGRCERAGETARKGLIDRSAFKAEKIFVMPLFIDWGEAVLFCFFLDETQFVQK